MKKSLFILLLLIVLSGCCNLWLCLDIENNFRIQNTTDQNLYLYVAYILPDTILPVEKPKLRELGTGENDVCVINELSVSESGFKPLKKGELLSVFFFLKDSVDAKPWSYIRDNNVVLDRYDLSSDILEGYNWRVPYPLPPP